MATRARNREPYVFHSLMQGQRHHRMHLAPWLSWQWCPTSFHGQTTPSMPVEIALYYRTLSAYIRLAASHYENIQRSCCLLDSSSRSVTRHGSLQDTMRVYNSLALCTLVVNWTLTVIALIAMMAMHCHRWRASSIPVRPEDILLLVSFVMGMVLVSLSTWAILDEGQAEHQDSISKSQLEHAAKVSDSLRTDLHS